jgi:hypothetical protein
LYLDGDGVRPAHAVDNGEMQLVSGPYFHPNEHVDVAAFKVAEIDSYTPVVKLGSNFDNMLNRSSLVLTEAIVLGYPPVPMTRHPVLIGARAEVNAAIDLYDVPYSHIVLSSMPRGGFSGGPAISEHDVALGVVTRSLDMNNNPPELGFMAVLGVDPIYALLAEHKLLPDCQLEGGTNLRIQRNCGLIDKIRNIRIERPQLWLRLSFSMMVGAFRSHFPALTIQACWQSWLIWPESNLMATSC